MPDSIPFVADTAAIADEAGRAPPVAWRAAPPGGALAAGWYSLHGRVDAPAPRLHLETGPDASIAIGLLASGEVAPMSVLRLPAPAMSLALRPGAGADEWPGGASLRLQPIGRLHAIGTMLAAHSRLGMIRALPALCASVAAS